MRRINCHLKLQLYEKPIFHSDGSKPVIDFSKYNAFKAIA